MSSVLGKISLCVPYFCPKSLGPSLKFLKNLPSIPYKPSLIKHTLCIWIVFDALIRAVRVVKVIRAHRAIRVVIAIRVVRAVGGVRAFRGVRASGWSGQSE